MNDSNEELQHHERPNRGGCVIVAMVVLPVLYILSPVPVMLLVEHSPPGIQGVLMPIAQYALAPLEWCYNNNEIVESFYDTLFEFFGTR